MVSAYSSVLPAYAERWNALIPEHLVRRFLLVGGLLIGVGLLNVAFVNPSSAWGLEAGLGRVVLLAGGATALLVGLLSWVTMRPLQ
ncbi:MAG: hypothetical protein LN412_03120 [Candidatus Thermoplasmatota archaeon]|nr:hypothetical protein [Candidatus Thermoplasmatota archaeon]